MLIICFSSASEAGYQAEADSQVRPGEECGPSPNWAMDAGQSVQRQCLCVEPWNTGMIHTYMALPHTVERLQDCSCNIGSYIS